MPAPLTDEQPSVELPDWSEVEALPEFKSLKPAERKKVATGYADDLRNHAKALPQADPAAIDSEVNGWLTKVAAQWDDAETSRTAAGQAVAGTAKSFLTTLGGALAGFGRLQEAKDDQAERTAAAQPAEAPLAPPTTTPERMQIFSSEDAARTGGLADGTVFMLRDAATDKIFKRVVGGAEQRVLGEKEEDTVAALAAGGSTRLGDAVKAAGETIQTDAQKDKSFWLGDVPNALGSAAGFVTTGLVGGPAATGLAGVALQMDSAYNNVARKAEEARARGEESRAVEIEGKQLEQMIFQAPIGALESLGVGGAPARWFKATPFGRQIQQGIGRYLFGASKEGLQESVQGALEDLSMRYGGVDPNANPLDLAKRGREFAGAAIVGGPLEMVSAKVEAIDERALEAQRKIMRDEASAVFEGSHPGMSDLPPAEAAAAKTRAQDMLTALDKAEVPFRQAEIRQEAEDEANGFEADGLTMSAAAAREFGEAQAADWGKAVEARAQQAMEAAMTSLDAAATTTPPQKSEAADPVAAFLKQYAVTEEPSVEPAQESANVSEAPLAELNTIASTPAISQGQVGIQGPKSRGEQGIVGETADAQTTGLRTETTPEGESTHSLDIAPDATAAELQTLSKTIASADGIAPQIKAEMQARIVDEVAKKEPVSFENTAQNFQQQPVVIDKTAREQFRDTDGAIDMAAFNDNVTTQVKEALDNGSRVTLLADNGRKEIAITAASSRGLVDDKGQHWGTFPIADGMSSVRIEARPSSPPATRDRLVGQREIAGDLKSLAAPPREAPQAWERATFEGVKRVLAERGVAPESVNWTPDAMGKLHATILGNHSKHGNGQIELLDRFRDTIQADLIQNARENGNPSVARNAAGEAVPYSASIRMRTIGSNFAEKFTAREVSGETADLIRDKAATPDGNRGQQGIPTHEQKQSVAQATWTALNQHVSDFVKNNPAPASAPAAKPDQIMRASRIVIDDIVRQRLGEVGLKRTERTGPMRSERTGTYAGQKGRPSKAVDDMVADPAFRAAVESQIFGGLTNFVKARTDASILDQLGEPPPEADLDTDEWATLHTIADAVKQGTALPLATSLLPERLQQRMRAAVESDGGYDTGSADVLRRIASAQPSGSEAQLQKVMANFLLANGDTVRIYADPTLVVRGANGAFNPRKNEIAVNPFVDETTRRWAILHEQTHALLFSKAEAYSRGEHHLLTNSDMAALDEIEELREHIIEQAGLPEALRDTLSGRGIGSSEFSQLLETDPDLRAWYPLTNIHEFFAGVMMDEEFQSLLHSIPDPAAASKSRTLWERLKALLRRLVSGQHTAESSVFARAFDRTIQLVNSGILEDQLLARFGDDFTFQRHAEAHQRFMDQFAETHGHESADRMALDAPELFIEASDLFRESSAEQIYSTEELASLASRGRDEDVREKATGRLRPLFKRVDTVRARTLPPSDQRLQKSAEERIIGAFGSGKASVEQIAEVLRDAGGLSDAQIEAASEAIHSHFAVEALSRGGTADAARVARNEVEHKVKSAIQPTTPRQRFSDAVHWLRLKLQDKFADLEAIQAEASKRRGISALPDSENTYQAQEIYHGIVGERLRQLTDDELPALIESVKASGITVAELNDYLYARHAAERNKQIATINSDMPDGGSGMTDAHAAAVLRGFDSAGKTAALQNAASKVDAVIRRGLDERLATGLIDQATYDRLVSFYQDYVPLKGRAGGGEDNSAGGDAMPGFDVRGPEFKRALGRNSRAGDILAQVFGDAAETVVRAEKTKVAQTLLEQVRQNPAPDVWEIATPEKMQVLKGGKVESVVDPNWSRDAAILAVKDGGETHYIRFKHEGLRRAFKEAGPGTQNALVTGLRRVTQYVALINTQLSPEFVISNFLRDFQGAGIRLGEEQLQGMRKAILRDTVNGRAVKGAWDAIGGKTGSKWSDAFVEMSQHGGRMVFLGHKDAADFERQIAKLAADPKHPTLETTKAVFTHVGNFIERANSSVENGIRLSTYVHAREAGLSAPKAAHLARTVTINFTRKGEWGSFMNALWVFSNASIQSTAQMALSASRSPAVRKTLAGVVVTGFVLDLINRSLGGDDDDGTPYYDKLPEYQKNSNLIVMLPNTGGRYVRIPLPYGYNVAYVMGRSTASALPKEAGGGGRSAATAASDTAVAALDAFNPLGGSTSLIRSLVPTIGRPFYEIKTNEDFAGRKIVPVQSTFAKFAQPPSQHYFPSVSAQSREITDTINRMTGGDQVKAGLLSVSPEYLDYWVQQLTGGVGTFAQRAINTTWKAASGEKLESDDIPFWRKFAGDVPRTATLQRFYDLREAAYAADARLTALTAEGATLAQIKAAEDESDAFIAVLPAIKAAEKELAGLRKSVRETRGSTAADKTKSARIETLQTQMLVEAKRALKRYNEITATGAKRRTTN